MLDIKLIRENPEVVKEDLKKRHDKEKQKMLDEVIKKDKKWRDFKKEVDDLKKQRNSISKEIAELKKKGKDASKKMKDASKIPDKIKEKEEESNELKERINDIMMRLPNILHESVPVGKDDHDNVETKKVGKPPKFDFEPKDHLTILTNLGLIDGERAAKTAGHGFYYNKEELALLDFALQRYGIDFLRERGYVLINPPYMLHRKAYEGVTDLGDFEEVMYNIDNSDMYLIATSEHSMAAMFMNETLDKDKLPIKFCGLSPCFRKEVGTHGKYTKGLFRMHQFHKIEQFIFCLPEESWKYHEELQKNAEELYESLGIHFRVVNVCTGDIGSLAAKKYDIEGWMADGEFRELGSNSNCTDYQARRLNVKYREKEGAAPLGFVHTLNNTALATSRTMVCLIEQHQNKDGTVAIPKPLQKYTGFKVMKPTKKRL